MTRFGSRLSAQASVSDSSSHWGCDCNERNSFSSGTKIVCDIFLSSFRSRCELPSKREQARYQTCKFSCLLLQYAEIARKIFCYGDSFRTSGHEKERIVVRSGYTCKAYQKV